MYESSDYMAVRINDVTEPEKHPKVSVVMPTYNRAKEIPRSIRSVLSQSFSDLELIIVDDASTDNTDEIISKFVDSRIRYEKLTSNVGGAEARNVGIRLARAEIVAFQDSDDEWTCSKLEDALRAFESDADVGAVFSKFIQVWPGGCRMMPVGIYQLIESDIYTSLLWQNHVDTPTLVVKKRYLEIVGGFTPEMPRYQDWDLALKLAKITKLKYLQEPTLLSYVTEGSITQNNKAHLVALELIYKQHAEAINSDKKLRAAWLHRLGDAKVGQGIKGGRGLLFQGFMYDPFNVRYFLKFVFSILGNPGLYSACKRFFGAGV